MSTAEVSTVPFRALSQIRNTCVRGDEFDDQLIFNFVSFTTSQKSVVLELVPFEGEKQFKATKTKHDLCAP